MRFLLAAALLFALPTYAAEHEFAQCLLCHGTDANGNIGIRAPKLSGMDRWYIARQLAAFRSGLRGTHAQDVNGSEMRTIASHLSEDATARAVDYIASLPSKKSTPTVSGDTRKGAALYATCAACHGKKGEGNAALNAPRLIRSSDWYLVTQLNNYRNGLRGTEPQDTHGAAMRAAASVLPDTQAVVNVVAYINTFR